MARKKSSQAVPPTYAIEQPYNSPAEDKWGGFINGRMSQEMKEEFSVWLSHNSDRLSEMFTTVLVAGVKVTHAYDGANQAAVVSFTGRLCGTHIAERWVCSSRAASPEEALALALWKHLEWARGDYSNFRPQSGEWLKWG